MNFKTYEKIDAISIFIFICLILFAKIYSNILLYYVLALYSTVVIIFHIYRLIVRINLVKANKLSMNHYVQYIILELILIISMFILFVFGFIYYEASDTKYEMIFLSIILIYIFKLIFKEDIYSLFNFNFIVSATHNT